MDLLFVSDVLAPPSGGAERVMLEWIDGLRERGHGLRAASLPPVARPAAESYWRWRTSQQAQMEDLVAATIAEREPDVVVAQLHGAPGAQRAAARAGVPTVLVLPSYESLCKIAFDSGTDCRSPRDCVSCPAARRLTEGERAALFASRRAHTEALSDAAELVVPSQAMAKVVEAWGGRAAAVVHPVGPSLPGSAGARWDGPVVCVAAQWSSIKGVELLPALAAAAGATHGREVRVTERGLDAAQREALRRAGAVLVSVGPIDALLAGAALVVVPSLWDEPFGRVAWEALARGVPVLASAAGGMAEHVPPELLVAPREDPAAWAAAIGALLGDEAAWRLAADRARGQAAAVLDPVPLDVLEGLLREVSPR